MFGDRRKTGITCGAVALAGLALTAGVMADDGNRFGGTVDVRVINIEVVITDAGGQRVPGLGPEDLRLLVDGKPASIDYFTEIRDGAAVFAEGQTEDAGPPPPAALPADAEDAMPANILVFVDEVFSEPLDRNRALRGLEGALDGLGPADQVAVVAYAGDRLELLSDWTGSKSTLGSVLSDAADRPTGGYMRRFERQDAESRTEQRTRVDLLSSQMEGVTDAASAAMRGLAAPPGRKVMVVLAGGWPRDVNRLLPITDRTYLTRRSFGRSLAALAKVTDTANLLGYTLYTFDVPGFEDLREGDAQDPGFSHEDLRLSGFASADNSIQLAEIEVSKVEEERQKHRSLFDLAQQTGGQWAINARPDQVLMPVLADVRSYYWIGFDASTEGDDVRHDIQVEAVDPALRVRSRRSYVDLSRDAELTMRVEGALLFGGGDELGDLVVNLGEPEKSGHGKVQMPVEVVIPMSKVVAVETADGYETRLEMRLGALSEKGSMSDIPMVPVVFRSGGPPGPDSVSRFKGTVELRKGAHDIVVTAYDPLGDRLLARRVHVGPTKG